MELILFDVPSPAFGKSGAGFPCCGGPETGGLSNYSKGAYDIRDPTCPATFEIL